MPSHGTEQNNLLERTTFFSVKFYFRLKKICYQNVHIIVWSTLAIALGPNHWSFFQCFAGVLLVFCLCSASFSGVLPVFFQCFAGVLLVFCLCSASFSGVLPVFCHCFAAFSSSTLLTVTSEALSTNTILIGTSEALLGSRSCSWLRQPAQHVLPLLLVSLSLHHSTHKRGNWNVYLIWHGCQEAHLDWVSHKHCLFTSCATQSYTDWAIWHTPLFPYFLANRLDNDDDDDEDSYL